MDIAVENHHEEVLAVFELRYAYTLAVGCHRVDTFGKKFFCQTCAAYGSSCVGVACAEEFSSEEHPCQRVDIFVDTLHHIPYRSFLIVCIDRGVVVCVAAVRVGAFVGEILHALSTVGKVAEDLHSHVVFLRCRIRHSCFAAV